MSDIDREAIVAKFVTHAAAYAQKQHEQSGDNVDRYTRWQMSLMAREVIEILASQLGILDDMRAAGYEVSDA